MRSGQRVDVVVVGSGAAGLMFAMEMAKSRPVVMLTKAPFEETNTRYAQGGIAAVLRIDDDYTTHIEDTVRAGDGLCDLEAVKVLVYEAPARIRDLMVAGVEFDRAPGRDLLFTREGGHRNWRVLHVGDMTGQAIEAALVQGALRNPRIAVHEHLLVTDLLVEQGVCYGLELLDERGRERRILARTVFLATGGAGQLFSHTTNPEIATGDGVAMAARAGARTENMEFIQFHPTALYHPPHPYFLISEAVRGEGGILRNHAGQRFMPGYDERGELAPRDIVSRAIVAELRRENEEHVWLDLTHLPPGFVHSRFPTISRRLIEFGVDPARQPIPVAPAAHYICGGVKTDIDGKTDVVSLYAGGEVACTGVHGANRLASNSLLESIVFAYRASVNADRYLRYLPDQWEPRARAALRRASTRPRRPRAAADPGTMAGLRDRLQKTMWERCGILRSDADLQQAWIEVEAIGRATAQLWSASRLDRSLVELRNLIRVAELVIEAALARRQNAGVHYNVDLPDHP